MSQDVA
jgi:hypothetical protein